MNVVSPIQTLASFPTPLWKRALDLCLFVLALPLLVPLTVLISLFIKLSSPGPILFSQTRVGRAGKPFLCYKFRTMKPNACASGHEQHLAALMTSSTPMTKLDRGGDSRIIPGGRLLRSSGLDELPQILNVLRGEMSIVGPRPCLPYEFALHNDHHKRRLAVVPGITGLWQVTGKNRTTFEEMIDFDLAYISRRSFGVDLSILWRTTGVILGQILESFSSVPQPAPPSTPAPIESRARIGSAFP